MWSAIDAQLATIRQADGNSRTPWKRMQVDAVIAAVSAGTGADRVPEVTILTDYATLVGGLHANSVCETVDGVPLPVSTVRRMCCDADIVPVVLGSNGEVLDVGRTERTANRAQRRALRAMHRTCAHPDCTVGFSACRVHHVKWWWRHLGRTGISNLLPLCERHHHPRPRRRLGPPHDRRPSRHLDPKESPPRLAPPSLAEPMPVGAPTLMG